MQRDLPICKGWLDRLPGDVLEDVLGGTTLRVLGVGDHTRLVEFQDVDEDGVGLLQGARLAENAGVIDALQQRQANGAVGDPEGERP